jgi:hypothetical protein
LPAAFCSTPLTRFFAPSIRRTLSPGTNLHQEIAQRRRLLEYYETTPRLAN